MSSLPEESSALSAGEHDGADSFAGMTDEGSDGQGMEMYEPGDTSEGENAKSKVMEYLQEAREDAVMPNGSMFDGYKKIKKEDASGDLGNDPSSTVQDASPAPSESTPDDTPSIHGSVGSSVGSSAFASRSSFGFSPSPSLRPFDRRFQSRLQPGSPSSRPLSPIYLNSSLRRSSITSELEGLNGLTSDSAPWDIVRWTKLKKVTSQLYSEVGRRNFGSPTCIAISATIIVGTSKGMVLVFDYYQNLKCIIGPGTKAIECGSITALAVSADHTTVASGHSQGHIFTWELTKPARPFLSIPPAASAVLESRKVEGHLEGVSVLHLGFLGTRHTALVSADGKGMAFSHLATRGLGAVGRTVKTTRILGRYSFDALTGGRQRKPSSVLAFAALPLGNAYQATDSMGLVAMLTPYLLVIISTTPVAQTQHKATRTKETASDVSLSGALAWFPAVKLKENKISNPTGQQVSKSKLAYSWSNILTVLELSNLDPDDPKAADRPPNLQFRARSRWRCDEAIVAIQWISRQILGVLTATQRLIILEDVSLRMTETFDLMPKQIIHHNVFSYQLRPLVNSLDEEGSAPAAVADSFYNSLKTYKGRIFLLCQYEVSVGALSNWADRLLAMMEVGDFIGAIQLATSYYVGEADKITVGLPEEAHLRHPLVQEKLLEMMSASLRYAFGRNPDSPRAERLGKEQLEQLCSACFVGCISMEAIDYLFDEVYEHYEGGSSEGIFLENLEPYILDGKLTSAPPIVVKALIKHFTSLEQDSRLEEILCHMDTRTFDIDQVTTLCKRHNLYDALIYVWNRALGDYITPMIDLLSLLIPKEQNKAMPNGESMYAVNALKIFPYLSYTLTGRVYPTGELLSDTEGAVAKASIYYFLFLGRTITWPRQGGSPFITLPQSSSEPSFPYLRLILQFDAPSFLSALNEAFEDPFLNGPAEQLAPDGKSDLTEEQMFARTVNRQYIVTILLEVMSSANFSPQDTIYLDMFIARNLPKFPQFILLTGTSLNRVLEGLCHYPGLDIADDCQLSVEYLLSVHRPPNLNEMITLFTEAKFYRVLKSTFRTERQYMKLVQAHFDDDEHLDDIFACIEDCLRPQSKLTEKQREEVRKVIIQHARKLVSIDIATAAQYINSYAPTLHGKLLEAINDKPEDQFHYLQAIVEPASEKEGNERKRPEILQNASLVELYIRLMCRYQPGHVPDFISTLQSGDLRLEEVLPAMEEGGVVDATVMLMAREGKIREAMDRLIKHLFTIEASLIAILQNYIDNPKDSENVETREGLVIILDSLKRYAQVGVWLCQGQMGSIKKGKGVDTANTAAKYKRSLDKEPLTKEELLWLDFVDTIVRIAKDCISLLNTKTTSFTRSNLENTSQTNRSSPTPHPLSQSPSKSITTVTFPGIKTQVTTLLRTIVQDTFTSLLKSTSSAPSTPSSSTASTASTSSFLRILRFFLKRAAVSSPSLSELRSVLAGIFDAHIYEKQLLSLANQLLDQDRFEDVSEAVRLRQMGWRPAGQMCEACGKRAWGPGSAGGIFGAWEERRIEEWRRKRERERGEKEGGMLNDGKTDNTELVGKRVQQSAASRGKGRVIDTTNPNTNTNHPQDPTTTSENSTLTSTTPTAALNSQQQTSPLILFTCRHIFHKSCLEKLSPSAPSQDLTEQRFKCIVCNHAEE